MIEDTRVDASMDGTDYQKGDLVTFAGPWESLHIKLLVRRVYNNGYIVVGIKSRNKYFVYHDEIKRVPDSDRSL